MTEKRNTRSSRGNAAAGKRRFRRDGRAVRGGFFRKLVRRHPRWAWWVGGLFVVVFYVWIFYYIFVGPFGFRWRALYGDAKYPEGYEIHGIDISHHQGEIDWELLRNAMIEKCPIRFILIKATEGTSIVDPRFKENFTQAREYGYFFLDNVILIDGDLPPVLDIENKPKDVSVEDFQRDVLTWLHIVEDRYHVKPIIYTYYKFKMNYLDNPVFDDYPYWIAHYYVDKVEYAGEWKFWQHTDAGRLPGIKGYVDFNIYNGSYYDLRKLTIGN